MTSKTIKPLPSRAIDERKPALLFLAASFLTVMLAVLITRFALRQLYQIEGDPALRWQRNRLAELLEAIPRIAESSEPPMIAIGTSSIELGFEPDRFDEASARLGVRIHSYNLGIRNLKRQLPFILERVKSEFTTKKRRLRLLLISVSPELLTYKTTSNPKFLLIGRDAEALLLDPRSLDLDLARVDPETLANAWVTRTLFQGRSSDTTLYNLRSYLFRRYAPQDDRRDFSGERAGNAYLRFWADPLFYVEPAWDPATRGFPNQGYIKDEKRWLRDTSAIERKELISESKRFQNISSDLTELHIDPMAIDDYVAFIHLAQQTADHAVLVYLPEHPSLHRDNEALERLNRLLDILRTRTSVTVLDYSQSPLFRKRDYFDVLHLNLSGRIKLADALAVDLAPILRADERASRTNALP